MRKPLLLAGLALTPPAAAHTLFLEFADHVLLPGVEASVALVNGEFGRSDNVITRDRMIDVSIVGPGTERIHPAESDWRDEGTTTWLDFRTASEGTHVIGVSTAPRVIELEPEAFNDYLVHEGVLDALDRRERAGEMGAPARERYSKHVKSVFQVGEARTGGGGAVLGYPIEIVPLANAADLRAGDSLPLRVLLDGEPLASQLVYASHAGFHGHDEAGAHVEAFAGRTNARGRVVVPVDEAGRWYVRLIHMTESGEPDVDYRSLWATLTFQVAAGDRRGVSAAVVAVAGGVAALVLAAGGAVVLSRRRAEGAPAR